MEAVIRWRRKRGVGSHSFNYNGKRYRVKPGDEISVPASVLGNHVKKYEMLEEVQTPSRSSKSDGKSAVVSGEKTLPPPPKGPQLVDIGGGYWDIINPDNPDKPLNDEPLSYEAALEILGKMEDQK